MSDSDSGTIARQAPLCSWNFPGKNTRAGCHFPFSSSGHLPSPEIKPGSPALSVDSLPSESPGKLWGCYFRQRAEEPSLVELRMPFSVGIMDPHGKFI